MPLNVIILGPPASGKGTQAVRLARSRGIPKISTGDMLRDAAQAGTELGLRAKALMDRGELLGDTEITGIVRERLAQPDAARGYILDGFPRTVPQAQALDRMVGSHPLAVINLAVPDADLMQRMVGRRVCSACGANADPDAESSETCLRCGGRMIVRADDSDENVRRRRLEVYECESRPLLDYYRGRSTFRNINGAQPPEIVARDVSASLDEMMPVAMGQRS